MAARQLEETMDVRGVFRSLRAFPRHAPVQAELTAPPDGAHGPNIGHRYALPHCCPPSSVMNSRRLHSITSSAQAIAEVGGTVRPNSLAVL